MTLFSAVDGVVHLPHLVRGNLVRPPQLSAEHVRAALGDGDYARTTGAQVIRDAQTGTFFVLPDVSGLDLVTDAGALEVTADVPVDSIVSWLEAAAVALLSTDEA
ncbi:MAG: hypothetical protein QOG52_147, partial [Frankiaceae bacterium]|nr:hypothetical protein [Frankiaceae bacterium]